MRVQAPDQPPRWFALPMQKSLRKNVLRYTLSSPVGFVEVQQFDHIRHARGIWQATWQGRETEGATAQDAIDAMARQAMKFADELLCLEADRVKLASPTPFLVSDDC